MPPIQPRVAAAALATVLAWAGNAGADHWDDPVPVTRQSPSGEYEVTLTPHGFEPAEISVTRKRGGGRQVLYKRRVVNRIAPVHLVVDDKGRVVTSGDWLSTGFEHELIVYSPAGKIAVDLPLERLLTAEEIEKKVTRSISSRWWIKDGAEPRIDGEELIVLAVWDQRLGFRITDGKRVTAREPYRDLSKKDRFLELLRTTPVEGVTVHLNELRDYRFATSCTLHATRVTCTGTPEKEAHEHVSTAAELDAVRWHGTGLAWYIGSSRRNLTHNYTAVSLKLATEFEGFNYTYEATGLPGELERDTKMRSLLEHLRRLCPCKLQGGG